MKRGKETNLPAETSSSRSIFPDPSLSILRNTLAVFLRERLDFFSARVGVIEADIAVCVCCARV